MSLYAAYAGNLDARLMTRRAPHSPLRGTGWLNGWRLTFGGEQMGWEGALATVVEAPRSQVFVALYDIAPMDEDSMDRWEGVGLDIYRRMRVRVHTLDGEEPAWMYVLNGVRGRAAVRPLSGRAGGRRRVGGRAARLRDGAAQAPLLSRHDAARHGSSALRTFVGNDRQRSRRLVVHAASTRVGNDRLRSSA